MTDSLFERELRRTLAKLPKGEPDVVAIDMIDVSPACANCRRILATAEDGVPCRELLGCSDYVIGLKPPESADGASSSRETPSS
jgi:hypothetical protein